LSDIAERPPRRLRSTLVDACAQTDVSLALSNRRPEEDHKMKRLIVQLLAWLLAPAILLAQATDAKADVMLAPGESVIYNFDLTGAAPPPPYPGVLWTFGYFSADLVELTMFDGLDGGGAVFYSNAANCCALGDRWMFEAAALDGVFSVLFGASGASATVATPWAAGVTGFHGDLLTPWFEGVISHEVPEPASLALVATILLALAFRRATRKARR
jgi:hypothetical protein